MRHLVLLAAALVLLAPPVRAQKKTEPAWASILPAQGAAITWTQVPRQDGEGRLIPAKTVHEGGGRPGKAYDSLFFKGTAYDLSPETRIFAFLIANDDDNAAVARYLESNRPRDWNLLPQDSPWRTAMTPRDRFLEFGLGADGMIIFTLDAYEQPDCMQLTALVFTDGTGRILDRLERK